MHLCFDRAIIADDLKAVNMFQKEKMIIFRSAERIYN